MSAATTQPEIPKYAVESWTACHLDHPDRLGYLGQAIRSIAAQSAALGGIYIRVSISRNETESRKTKESIAEELSKNASLGAGLELTFWDEKKTQLEHLLLLHKSCKAPADTWIMFMDDDDYVLPAYAKALQGCSSRAMQGVHMVMVDGSIVRASDFSGYTARRDVIDGLFASEAITQYAEPHRVHMCDLAIMDYLDNHGATEPEAFTVFHRLWDNPRTWWQDAVAEKQMILKETEKLHGQTAEITKQMEALGLKIEDARKDPYCYRPRGNDSAHVENGEGEDPGSGPCRL